MTFVTSDLHINHDREFLWGPRGFKSVQEMNAKEVENWNKLVKPQDDVYVLGDLALGTDIDLIRDTVNSLNGRIHLIRGNHDTDAKIRLYETMPEKIVEITWATQIKCGKRVFHLCHYPTYTAQLDGDPERAVISLYGHLHVKDKFYEDRPYMYNVGMDAHDNTPVALEDVCFEVEEKIKECLEALGE